MFGLFYGLLQQCLRKEEIHLLIVGLDQSGKTTLLERIKHNVTGLPSLERDQIVPTVGLNVGRVQLEHAAVVLWDLGGRPRLRSIWDKYYDETHAVMFVVDATDRERFGEVKQELEKTLAHSDLLGAPCLVVANKQDHGNAMDSAGIAEEFGIGKVDSRACKVMGMSAIDGTGVDEGLHWLLHHVRRAQRTALLRQAAGKRGGR